MVQMFASGAQSALYIIWGQRLFSFVQHLKHQPPWPGRLVSLGLQNSNRVLDHGGILPDGKNKCNNIAISLEDNCSASWSFPIRPRALQAALLQLLYPGAGCCCRTWVTVCRMGNRRRRDILPQLSKWLARARVSSQIPSRLCRCLRGGHRK